MYHLTLWACMARNGNCTTEVFGEKFPGVWAEAKMRFLEETTSQQPWTFS